MTSTTVARKSSCFISDDDDDKVCCSSVITSLSGSSAASFSRSGSIRRFHSSLISYSSSSPRFGPMYKSRFDDRHHLPQFLQTCAFCRKPIAEDQDIFMYRGDTPFCSEECRQEQIDLDDAMEKRKTTRTMMISSIKDQKSAAAEAASKAGKYSLRTTPVAAA